MDVASMGVIIRRADGSFLAGFLGPTNASFSIEAETLAILEGCKLALHEGLNNVIIESDSREAISSVQGSIARGRWQLYPLLKTIKQFSSNFHQRQWSWIPRTANLAVDHLDKLSSSRMRSFVWVDRPPSSLTGILNKDGLPCPPPQNGLD
ncbi:hypothetical protein CerSpe_250330 [Prunus speciosa]